MPATPSRPVETLRINRSNWTGKEGTISRFADGTFEVEDLGRFRLVDQTDYDQHDGVPGDFYSWGVVSVDGEWTPDFVFHVVARFRDEVERENATRPLWRERDAAVVLWNKL